MRTRPIGVVVLAFMLAAAACGQKPGVAGRVTTATDATGAAVDATGGDLGTTPTDGTTPAGGATSTGGGGGGGGGTTGGGATAASGGGGGAAPASGGGGAAASGGEGPADRTGVTASEIRIGIHAPITGAAAVQTFTKGAGVYSNWAGKLPKVGNRRMVVVTKDDKFQPQEARLACQEMVQKNKVFLLIGGAGADQIQSCAQYANQVGVPYLSPGVTEEGFKGLANYFALSETYSQQNVQLAQYIKKALGNKKVGVVLTDSPLLSETEKSIKAQGLKVVATKKLAKDAGPAQTDTIAGQLKAAGAEIVYALISPTVFVNLIVSGRNQQFLPIYTGPGLSIGLNLVAKLVCVQVPNADVRYLSPMVQLDQIDQRDPNYRGAYRSKPGNSAADSPDDIGILLWGIEKAVRLMLDATGADLSRQSFIKTLQGGTTFSTNVYAPVKYSAPPPHFGAKQTTLLKMNCTRTEFDTVKAFASGF